MELLKKCSECLPIIVAGEVMEAVLSFGLQADAYFRCDVEDVLSSICCRLLAASKAARLHSTREKVYWSTNLSSINADDLDQEFPIITGPWRN